MLSQAKRRSQPGRSTTKAGSTAEDVGSSELHILASYRFLRPLRPGCTLLSVFNLVLSVFDQCDQWWNLWSSSAPSASSASSAVDPALVVDLPGCDSCRADAYQIPSNLSR